MKAHQAIYQPSLSAAKKARDAKDAPTPEARRTTKTRLSFHRTGPRCGRKPLFAAAVMALGLTALPAPAGAVHQWFDTAKNWTNYVPFYGTDPWTQTLFADVDGDGKADAIAVKSDGIRVRYSDGCRFGPETKLTSSPFYGTEQTAFADVTGDKKADAIAIDREKITVRRSEDKLRVITDITEYADKGVIWHYFADVGTYPDGKADLIALTRSGVYVRKSLGSGSFDRSWKWDPPSGFPGELSTHFADVTGDKRADAIAVTYSGIIVYAGGVNEEFPPFSSRGQNWTPDGPLYGDRWEFFVNVADVRNGGVTESPPKADVVVDNWDGLAVRHSLGTRFAGLNKDNKLIINSDEPRLPWGYWTETEFVGNIGGTGFADVTGDGLSEPIAINSDGLWVRRNMFGGFFSSCP